MYKSIIRILFLVLVSLSIYFTVYEHHTKIDNLYKNNIALNNHKSLKSKYETINTKIIPFKNNDDCNLDLNRFENEAFALKRLILQKTKKSIKRKKSKWYGTIFEYENENSIINPCIDNFFAAFNRDVLAKYDINKESFIETQQMIIRNCKEFMNNEARKILLRDGKASDMVGLNENEILEESELVKIVDKQELMKAFEHYKFKFGNADDNSFQATPQIVKRKDDLLILSTLN